MFSGVASCWLVCVACPCFVSLAVLVLLVSLFVFSALFAPSLGLFWTCGKLLGILWALLGVLGPILRALGSSWGSPKASWEPLGTSWASLGASWDALGASWGLLGAPEGAD